MSTAICLIVKNEVENIAEWVAHNTLIGFDRIFVYDNHSTDGTSELLAQLARDFPVEVRSWGDEQAVRGGACKQMSAYADCLERHGPHLDWLAFLDADEFLVPPPGETLADLLDAHHDHDGLAFNWRIFGSSGLQSTPGRLVMEAFNRRAVTSDNANRHVKMIFRPIAARRLINPHYVELASPVVGVDGCAVQWSEPGITMPGAIVSGAWRLHHYIIRSRAHWERRIARKQTDHSVRDWSEFERYDRNEVLDASAYVHAQRAHARLASHGFAYEAVPQTADDAPCARVPVRAGAAPASSRLVCFLDAVHGGLAHGWAHDPAQAVGSTSLRVLIDGAEQGSVLCDLARPDVLASGVGKEHVGFRFAINPAFLDGATHSLEFRDADGCPVAMAVGAVRRTAFGFRDRFSPELFSAVDEMQQSVLRGWAACRRAPDGPIEGSLELLVCVNGEEVATVRADRPRPDVAASLGCDSACGFAVRLPAAYRSPVAQEFRLFVMPERVELSGSPLVTSVIAHDHATRLSGLIEQMNGISSQIDALRAAVKSIIPSGGFTLESYDPWAREAARRLRARMAAVRDDGVLSAAPLVSILCPVFRPSLGDFAAAVRSVMAQTYANWELILVDDGSDDDSVSRAIARLCAEDSRIRIVGDGRNRGISGATNFALKAARGAWIAFFDHDDLLVDVALECMMRHALTSGARLLYSDEDKIDEFGFFSEPAFKPDWSYRYLLGVNYINHLTLVQRTLARKVGLLDRTMDGAQDHDFLLRAIEHLSCDEICHVPEVLYHWRRAAQSTASSGAVKPYAVAAGERCIAAHLDRMQRPATVRSLNGGTLYRIDWQYPQTTRVAVIIPFKDRSEMTARCVAHLQRHTDSSNLDIILVDNGSVEEATRAELKRLAADPTISVLRVDEPFNYSRLNNLAVQNSTAEFFVFMNNDLFVQDNDWLPRLLSEATTDETVGAVGGKFLFENRTIQHSGVVLGLGGVAGHVFVGANESYGGYGNRALVAHEVSAVTAACMLVRAEVFRAVGGFDETDLKVAFNDIDLCLRIREAGHRIIMAPEFVAEHHESISRGSEDSPEKASRFRREAAIMQARWGQALLGDPFYSKNFSLDQQPYFNLAGME
ncbi:glycosyltransferase family 2 protein [Lichenicoccus sp.]|uniref:glycosyltransferase family 2 protein n=1 Tax=Lichenicoccus sp. TaxID=2781899 RepID=UPI003D0EE5E2